MLIPALSSCNILTEFNFGGSSDDAKSTALIQDTVLVSVSDGKGYTVDSANPLLIARGTDAIFKITIDEDYEFQSTSSSDAVYERGIIGNGIFFTKLNCFINGNGNRNFFHILHFKNSKS